ncbi:protein MOR1 [Dioscorea cayenensis subsp. rotundata]|uniref:Protein MOR1 n=1 Tax=Dioscorea cayennensis subsp. rotundata TaxID=55577 RepID=A0AB40AHH0_DIOCR|nr:protein MOR1 [Dioscorea cayenensis subsp. rotundata]
MSTEDEKLLKEAKKLPWDERLTHKNWKVRNDANIDLAAVCDSITDPKDPRLRDFGPLFRKTVADSNAPVQEKALDALIAFLRAADADAGRYAKETCDAIVAKCLTGRPKTVEKSQAVFMLWVELEAVDVFLEAMEKAIKNKVAKAVVPAIDVMFQALSEFGAKVIPPKKILKMLPELFDHQDQNVRASSKGLTLELCRWIGKDPVKSILFEKMRDTMKKELEAELANVTGTARPTRKIRSEQDKEPEQEVISETAGTGASEDSVLEAPQEIDEYELVDPVDILTPLDKSGFWDGVKATKWSERRDAVAELTKLASTKRIAPGDFTEICRTLKKLVTDVNLAVSVEAIQAIGNLGRGLRNHFSGSSRFLLPVLLEKLKEKKPTVTEALMQTLQALYKAGCLSLVDVVEDIKVAVKNKVPLVRSLTLNWVTFCTETSNRAAVLKLHKDYVPICMECLNDGTPEVRDAAFAVLAAIAKMVGMKPLERSLEKLDDVRKKKLSEMIGNSSGGMVSVAGSVSTSSGGVSGHEVADSAFVRRSAASMLSGKKPVQAAPTAKKGGPAKPSVVKKAEGSGQLKTSVSVESEDVEISIFSKTVVSILMIDGECSYLSGFTCCLKDLEADLMKYFREDLHRRLLSTDFKKQVDGLELLQKALPTNIKELIELLDVLLRWFVLRFCESNTTCLLKVLEFLPELVDTLKDEGYTLTESEAATFLPCLVEKSGHNIEKVREKMRELMKQIVHIYSASKLLPYVLEGLRSKNNRSRIECVDFVGYLIDYYGAEITGQLKSLQLVAGLTSERDGDLRKAALNTLATAYKSLGEDIWRYVGKLTDAQKSMLDDRFKWKAREMDKRKEGKPGEGRGALRRSVRENGMDVAEQSGELLSRSLAAPMVMRVNPGYGESNVERHVLPRMLITANGPTDWHEALDVISMGSPEQSVEGMKVICHELTQATTDPENSVIEDLAKEADRLVECLAAMVPKTFNFSLSGASSRSCKYVLNTLMQTFQIKRLGHAVKESTLDNLITELLLWLLDERVPLMDDGSQLLKALNVLMLKILDNAERTSSFVVLINLLRPLDPSRWPSPASNEAFITRNQKFSDLVVKCLIKLTKVLQSTIYDVDLDRILQSIHVYLQELGMEEIRRRAGADDKPLRMVKTVLHELVKLRGTAIKGHLSMVPIDMEPQPIILAYIDLNLQTLAAARMLTPSGPIGQTHWGDSASNSPNTTSHSADAQLKQELAAVFKKIGDKQTCTIGLYELYRITQLYPKVDIFAQLQNASEAFRTYIRDGLAQMEKNAAAGRTPSSLPMSTPPPLTLTTSPKFAPLSPVHTKSLNVKPENMSSNLLPSYMEDDGTGGMAFRGPIDSSDFRQLGDDRHDRYPSGAPAITPGTLDAIRERMKSIQAAAAAGNLDAGSRSLAFVNGSVPHGMVDRIDAEPPVHTNVLPMDEKALSGLQARMERLKSGSLEPL